MEVAVEQYATKVNIEAETAASIARTMLLPAAVRHLNELLASGREGLIDEFAPLVGDFHKSIVALERRTRIRAWRAWISPSTSATPSIPAMTAARTIADTLEKLVADDLWPLPKYSESAVHQVADSGCDTLARVSVRGWCSARGALGASASSWRLRSDLRGRARRSGTASMTEGGSDPLAGSVCRGARASREGSPTFRPHVGRNVRDPRPRASRAEVFAKSSTCWTQSRGPLHVRLRPARHATAPSGHFPH